MLTLCYAAPQGDQNIERERDEERERERERDLKYKECFRDEKSEREMRRETQRRF